MQVFARFCSASFSCQNSNKIPISHTVHPKIFSPTHTLRIVLLTFSLPSLRFTKKHTPPPFRGISFFFFPPPSKPPHSQKRQSTAKASRTNPKLCIFSLR